jgi:beta-N-acetylhexosaminidase
MTLTLFVNKAKPMMKRIVLLLLMVGSLFSGVIDADAVRLREKISQLLIIGFEGSVADKSSLIAQTIARNSIGGVILFDYNYQTQQFDKNIQSPAQVRHLNEQLQRINHQANKAHRRPDLPLLISVDYEGGQVNRLNTQYGFPETLSAAQAGKMGANEINQAATRMAETLDSSGFNLNFAPVLDVAVNPNNPVIAQLERSFSDDPRVVADDALLYSQQFLNHHVQCAYKHFPGHGSSTTDSHLGFVDVTDTWRAYELYPYQQLLNTKGACGMVMTAHIVNRQLDSSGLPATLSYPILTGLLREKLHFDGVIVTDDMQMKAIREHYGLEFSLVSALNAGVDMFIFGNQLTIAPQNIDEVIDLIEKNVQSGAISQERIDEAYRHVMTFKQSIVDP